MSTTPRRRGRKGLGSVYRVGDKWRAEWNNVLCADGVTRKITGTASSTEDAIKRRKENYDRRMQTITGSTRTLRSTLNEWEARNTTANDRSRRMIYRSIENHIFPRLSPSTPLSKLTHQKMEAVTKKLITETSPSIAYESWGHLRMVLNFAVKQGWLTQNPMDRVTRPKRQIASRRGDEAWINRRIGLYEGLLKYLHRRNDPAYTWVLFLSLGLRRNELLGITWDDVVGLNGRNPKIVIQNQYRPSPSRIEPGTKGKKPRDVPLPAPHVKALKEWKKQWTKPRNKWAENQVFTRKTAKGDVVGFTPSKMNPWWTRLLTEYININGVRSDFDDYYFSPHKVRHISASWMGSIGVPMPVAQEILGHSTAEMTRWYTQATSQAKRDAVKELGQKFNGGTANPDADSSPGPTKNAPESP